MAGGDTAEPHDPDHHLDYSIASDILSVATVFSSAILVDLRIWRLLQRDVPFPEVARRTICCFP